MPAPATESNIDAAILPRTWSNALEKTTEARTRHQHEATLMQPLHCEVEETSPKKQ